MYPITDSVRVAAGMSTNEPVTITKGKRVIGNKGRTVRDNTNTVTIAVCQRTRLVYVNITSSKRRVAADAVAARIEYCALYTRLVVVQD